MLRQNNPCQLFTAMTSYRGSKRNIFGLGFSLGCDKQNLNTNYNCLPGGCAEEGCSWELYSWLMLRRRTWDPWLGISVSYPGKDATQWVYHLPVCGMSWRNRGCSHHQEVIMTYCANFAWYYQRERGRAKKKPHSLSIFVLKQYRKRSCLQF